MDTYHAQLQSAEFASSMMKLGCYLFMAIVGLIGFMNMANTMIMNITTKKQEYGVSVSYTHIVDIFVKTDDAEKAVQLIKEINNQENEENF